MSRRHSHDLAATNGAPADDWLRYAMTHWLEGDAPTTFARMRDGHWRGPR
jgi:hypothetical protein